MRDTVCTAVRELAKVKRVSNVTLTSKDSLRKGESVLRESDRPRCEDPGSQTTRPSQGPQRRALNHLDRAGDASTTPLSDACLRVIGKGHAVELL